MNKDMQKEKKIPFLQIKELLPELCSADLELVITEATKRLRIEAIRETVKTIQLANNPKVVETFNSK
jgi:hypothetical protein